MATGALKHKSSVENDAIQLQPYKHRKLPKGDYVRILELIADRPGNSSVNSRICTMRLEDAQSLSTFPVPESPGGPTKPAKSQSSIKGYEALSWTWGRGQPDQSIRVLDEIGRAFYFKVHEHLYRALLALRYTDKSRHLWIDAICIDQNNIPERNHQVAQMSDIYGGAKNVCIWLGVQSGTPEKGSTEAMRFIREDILDIYGFDTLCKDERYLKSWTALLDLMKRDWFSRRWIVQEVSLARRATVHCGDESIDWQDFAAAVSLFVDVDNSARRLSELARKKEQFAYANDFFEEVSALGATMLVKTTNMLFKRSAGVLQRTAALEDVVARLAMSDTSEPRDTIYALLALAKDSSPSVAGIPDMLEGEEISPEGRRALRVLLRVLPSTRRRSYAIEYQQPIVDVYQQFIAFSIANADPTRALDIICRPFAQSFTRAQNINYDETAKRLLKNPEEIVPLPSWIPNVSEVAFVKQRQPRRGRAGDDVQEERFTMKRQRGDPFVSTPENISYSAAGTRAYDKDKVRFRKRQGDVFSMFVEGFVLDEVASVEPASQGGTIPQGWFALRDKYEKADPDIFWKTLVADRSAKGNAPVFYQKAIEAALECAPPSAELNVSQHIDDRRSELVSEVLRQVRNTIWGRSLFETSRFHLGLAPGQTRTDDLVCILYGCSVPVILRRIEKSRADREREDAEDEDDRKRRQEKVRPFIESFAARWRRKHPRSGQQQGAAHAKTASALSATDHAAILGSVQQEVETSKAEARSNTVFSWTKYLAGRPFVLLFLLVLVVLLLLQEPLSANMLLLLAAPHMYAQSVSRYQTTASYWKRPPQEEVMYVVGMVAIWLIPGRKAFVYALVIIAILDFLYPALLPSRIAQGIEHAFRQWSTRLWAAWRIINSTAEVDATPITPTLGEPDAEDLTAESPALAHSVSRHIGTEQTPAARKSISPKPAVSAQTSKPSLRSRQTEDQVSHGPNPTHYYQLIGECYVHNMMNGEAIAWQNESVLGEAENRVRAQIFELR